MEDKYLYMIRKAQEFMNENHFADVSRVQCLLRKMMSKEYHGLIDQIKECQDPHVIFNIHGGNNLIAPNASQAEQKVVEKPADELKNKIRNNQERRPMDLQVQRFSDIDLNDSFFDSLRASYPEFNEWYNKKAAAGATAYCYYVDNELKDFLYLKIEEEELSDLTPALPAKKRLKVGTFKVDNDNRHTTRGERFMKKIMDMAIAEDVDELLNNHYEKMVEQISQKEMELKKLKTELLHKDKQRRLDWEKKQKELKLIFSFMYIASFTRKAKFQASSVRDNTVEKLLREIVDCSLEYFEFESSEPMKNRQIDISFRIISALEGMELLRPFIDNPKIGRQMSEVLKSLLRLRERYDKGDIFEHDDVDFVSLKREMKTLKRMKWE